MSMCMCVGGGSVCVGGGGPRGKAYTYFSYICLFGLFLYSGITFIILKLICKKRSSLSNIISYFKYSKFLHTNLF